MDSTIRPLMETIDQPGLEFNPVTTGYEAIRETVSPAEAASAKLTWNLAPQLRERHSTMSSFQNNNTF